jgi:TolB protein
LSAAAWSPSGEQLAYLERDTLFVAALAEGATRRLSVIPTGHSPAWSPDGRWIVLGSGNAEFAHGSYVLGGMAGNELILVPAAGGEPVSLTDRWNLHTSPVWLPDSRHILFMSTQGGGRDIHVLRIDAAGHRVGAPERLTTGLDVATLAISADGKTLAYSAFDNASGIWSIDIPPAGAVTSSASARPVTRGTEHVEEVSVSPDGEWLAFDSDRAGNSDIYVMSLAGGEPRRITTDPGFDFVPSWSPDGKEIVYQSSRNGTRDVFVIGADGAGDRMVAGGPADETVPDWAPDGRRIVFHRVRPDNVSLFVSERAADGSWGDARQLSAQYGHVPRWSPDGQTILYKCRPTVPVPSGPARGLCRIAPDGTGQRHLLEPHQFPGGQHRVLSAAWAPDGRTIYVSAGNDSSQQSVWTLPAAGGTPRLIVRLDDPDRPPGRGAFDTDGRRLYFTFARRHSDIKAMEIRRTR